MFINIKSIVDFILYPSKYYSKKYSRKYAKKYASGNISDSD